MMHFHSWLHLLALVFILAFDRAESLQPDVKRKPEMVDLHFHLGGSWPLQYLQKIAMPRQIEEFLSFLDKIDHSKDYHEGIYISIMT